MKAAADDEREDPVGAEGRCVDGGSVGAEPGQLEHRGEHDGSGEDRPSRSHDQPGDRSDDQADDDRPDRFAGGERAARCPPPRDEAPCPGGSDREGGADSPVPPDRLQDNASADRGRVSLLSPPRRTGICVGSGGVGTVQCQRLRIVIDVRAHVVGLDSGGRMLVSRPQSTVRLADRAR